jgi:hypothetical protein
MFAIFGAQAFGLVLLVFQVAHPTWGALLGLITVVATLWALAMAFLACYHGPTHDITGSTLKDALEDTGVRPSYRNDDDDVYEPTAEVVNEDPKPSPPPAPPTRPTSPNGGITRPPKQ